MRKNYFLISYFQNLNNGYFQYNSQICRTSFQQSLEKFSIEKRYKILDQKRQIERTSKRATGFGHDASLLSFLVLTLLDRRNLDLVRISNILPYCFELHYYTYTESQTNPITIITLESAGTLFQRVSHKGQPMHTMYIVMKS